MQFSFFPILSDTSPTDLGRSLLDHLHPRVVQERSFKSERAAAPAVLLAFFFLVGAAVASLDAPRAPHAD